MHISKIPSNARSPREIFQIFTQLALIYKYLNWCKIQSFFQNLDINLRSSLLYKSKNETFQNETNLEDVLHQSQLPQQTKLQNLLQSEPCCVLDYEILQPNHLPNDQGSQFLRFFRVSCVFDGLLVLLETEVFAVSDVSGGSGSGIKESSDD